MLAFFVVVTATDEEKLSKRLNRLWDPSYYEDRHVCSVSDVIIQSTTSLSAPNGEAAGFLVIAKIICVSKSARPLFADREDINDYRKIVC